MSVSCSTLSRFTAADRRTPALRTTAVKPSSRLSRARRLRIMCNKNQKELLDEVIAKMDKRNYGRTVGSMDRVLASLPDRGLFVPEGQPVPPYQDNAASVYLNDEFVTIVSQPSVQVTALLELEPYLPRKGRALDVGSGSGYITACLSNLAGREGLVIGVENNLAALNYGKSCIENWNKVALQAGNVTFKYADVFGDEPFAYDDLKRIGPYDVIYVGAAAFFPEEVLRLLELLKPGGAMVVPQYQTEIPGAVKSRFNQVLVTYTKSEQGVVRAEEVSPAQFVKLSPDSSRTSKDGWD